MKPGGISCQEVVDLLTAYVEDALPPAEKAQVDAHLAGCDPCVRFLAQLRATSRAVGAVTLEDHPDRAVTLATFRNFTFGTES